jgi:hypothetical protein
MKMIVGRGPLTKVRAGKTYKRVGSEGPARSKADLRALKAWLDFNRRVNYLDGFIVKLPGMTGWECYTRRGARRKAYEERMKKSPFYKALKGKK